MSIYVEDLVQQAEALFEESFPLTKDNDDNDNDPKSVKKICSVAPGRVNLIGEHVDYTGGFVLPLAIDYSTVCYGRGKLLVNVVGDDGDDDDSSQNNAVVDVQCVSQLHKDSIETWKLSRDQLLPTTTAMTNLPSKRKWILYVLGVVAQYVPDLPPNHSLQLQLAIVGNVPLGGGLSSSASLEVSVARFLEEVLGEDLAFSSSFSSSVKGDKDKKEPSIWRALRCQKAENEWCNSPCGIMDQYVSSAASKGKLLLIDCRSKEYEAVTMKETTSNNNNSSSKNNHNSNTGDDDDNNDDTATPVLVVCNSHVSHDIAGGEYPILVEQCKTATAALQTRYPDIRSLRDATIEQVEACREPMKKYEADINTNDDDYDDDAVSYKRARHVVTENARTLQAKDALIQGDWVRVGTLMNASHTSMRDDYQVSCEEIDILVELAQSVEGVYGSRLTGGGFGGCTVTLVKPSRVEALMEYLRREYKVKTGTECDCFVTSPGEGARIIQVI